MQSAPSVAPQVSPLRTAGGESAESASRSLCSFCFPEFRIIGLEGLRRRRGRTTFQD